jgi:hypothetical protein
MASSAFTGEIEEEYYGAASKYFEIPGDSIKVLLKQGIKGEDIAVAIFVAKKAVISYEQIGKLRAKGDSWSGITENRSLSPELFYIMISGEITSKTFGPILEKFNSTPPKDWNKIEMTDSDIINLVNLRFISSHYDYSVFEIMTMRDFGKDFVKIANQVSDKKAEMFKKDKQRQKEASEKEAKAKEKEKEESGD